MASRRDEGDHLAGRDIAPSDLNGSFLAHSARTGPNSGTRALGRGSR